ETWACQELRKANVLCYAARYAQEPLRAKLLERGEFFSGRAWADFERFPSKTVTRALALMMREGPPDVWLRENPPTDAPPPGVDYPFGKPEMFVPQKQRVKAMLKSPRGLLRGFLRLMDIRNWR